MRHLGNDVYEFDLGGGERPYCSLCGFAAFVIPDGQKILEIVEGKHERIRVSSNPCEDCGKTYVSFEAIYATKEFVWTLMYVDGGPV